VKMVIWPRGRFLDGLAVTESFTADSSAVPSLVMFEPPTSSGYGQAYPCCVPYCTTSIMPVKKEPGLRSAGSSMGTLTRSRTVGGHKAMSAILKIVGWSLMGRVGRAGARRIPNARLRRQLASARGRGVVELPQSLSVLRVVLRSTSEFTGEMSAGSATARKAGSRPVGGGLASSHRPQRFRGKITVYVPVGASSLRSRLCMTTIRRRLALHSRRYRPRAAKNVGWRHHVDNHRCRRESVWSAVAARTRMALVDERDTLLSCRVSETPHAEPAAALSPGAQANCGTARCVA
jgi:hypothetical protein